MKYNGVDLRTIHSAISINKEIPPGIAPREVTTVRGAGAEHYAGLERQRAEYRVKVNIACRTPAEAWRVRALLARWAAGNGQPAALEPTHWPGMAYEAVVKSVGNPEFMRGFATVEVIFLLPDGEAYEIGLSRASGTGGSMSMQVDGSDACTPIITQTMSGAAGRLVWSLDGAPFLTLKEAVSSGRAVEMDLSTGSLTIDGVHAEAAIDYTASSWMPGFLPGKHTVTSSNTGEMQARWHDKWQ